MMLQQQAAAASMNGAAGASNLSTLAAAAEHAPARNHTDGAASTLFDTAGEESTSAAPTEQASVPVDANGKEKQPLT